MVFYRQIHTKNFANLYTKDSITPIIHITTRETGKAAPDAVSRHRQDFMLGRVNSSRFQGNGICHKFDRYCRTPVYYVDQDATLCYFKAM